MATEIAKAYVQIIPSADGISGKLSSALGGEAASAGDSAGASLGKGLVSSMMKVVAAAGIGKLLKDTISAGGDLEQSFGGLDTIYGDAADAAKAYSKEAQAAGISMNDYAEQAVSFGASLKQAYGGDTAKAVDAANTAILDMADNAAKMGTPLESIQNAYQGFAKQNYTMLDNLKLGYGGTKQEMERLLADAQKLSGVEYNIDNLGDVYDAIHVIQEDLGLTGVAADEASETFTGSLQAMKAAAKNLMAGLALGEDVQPHLDSLRTAIITWAQNLMPMIGNVLKSLPDVLTSALSMAIQSLNLLSNNAQEILQLGIDLVTGLVEGVVEMTPYLLEAAWNLITAFGSEILSTDWSSIATDLINSLKEKLSHASGKIFGSDKSIIDALADSIEAGLPGFLDKGIEIVTNIVNGILENLPALITGIGTLITRAADFLLRNMPMIMQKGAEMVKNLVTGIIKNLPAIVTSVAQVVAKFIATVASRLPEIIKTGWEILTNLVVGIIKAIPEAITKIPEVVGNIKDEFLKFDWLSLGGDIIRGIVDGIKSFGSSVMGAINDLTGGKLEEIQGALSEKWEAIKTTASTAAQNIAKAFSEKFPGIAETVSSTLESAKGYAQEKLDLMQAKFEESGGGINGVVSAAMEGVKSCFSDAYNAINNLTGGKLEEMRAKFSEKFEAAKDIANKALDKMKGYASEKLNNIKNAYDEHGGGVKGIVSATMEGIKSYYSIGYDALNTLTDGKLGEIMRTFTGKFSEMANKAYNWGSDIINGIVEGISSMIGKVRDAASSVASAIAEFIHFSEPDVGPLSDFHTYMPDMMKALASGIRKGIPMVQNAMDDLASEMLPTGTLTVTPSVPNASASGSVVINVYGADGQDVNALANIVMQKITHQMQTEGMAFG